MHELRLALRTLARSPGITLVGVATLALGLGAALGVGAYAMALLWPPVDAPHPERIVRLDGDAVQPASQPFSYPDLQQYRRHSRTVPEIAANAPFGAVVELGDQVRFGWAQTVTGNYFALFDARPSLGRLLEPEDENEGATPVAVLGHFFWRHRLGADRGVVGRQIEINGRPFTVVGVAREGFVGAGLPAALYVTATFWDEVTGRPGQENDRGVAWLWPVGRLAPGVSLRAAAAELSALSRSLREAASGAHSAAPESSGSALSVDVFPITQPDSWDSWLNRAARVQIAGAALLLLLAASNVAHLVLAQASATRRQLGVQAALGAGRRRLAGRRLLEGLLLVTAAAPFAIGLARILASLAERYALITPVGLGDWAPGLRLIRFGPRIWGLALALALLTAVWIALAPALQALRLDLAGALRSDASAGAQGARRWSLRRGLVVLQVALAVMLLIGAGLLGSSLWRASSVDPGFEPEGLLLATFFVPRTATAADHGAGALAFYRDLLARASTLPGVRTACLARHAPLGGLASIGISLPDHPEDSVETAFTAVSAGYFATVGLDLVSGRTFDGRDRQGGARVVVVNRSFAEQHLGGPLGVGRFLRLEATDEGEPGPEVEVVGVVEDARLGRLLEPPAPTVFVPYEQWLRPRMKLLVRSDVPAGPLASALRRWLRAQPVEAALVELASFDDQLHWALFYPEMNARLALLFGLLGLVLAVTGVGSVMAYSISRRRREMGIRMALGATPAAVRTLAHREALRLVGLGLVLGVGAGLATSRLLEGLLYHVGTLDPRTFVAAPLILAAAAIGAADLPARRAARVDPCEALVAE